MIKHRVIQPLTEILIKKIYHLKKSNKTVMIFFSVPSRRLLLDSWRKLVQYSDKFMPGIVLYCLHITILYKSNDNNKKQSKTI